MAGKEEGQLIATVEFGEFAGIEDHEMESEMKIAVNKPLTGLASKNSQRVFGERIEVYKKKLGAHVNENGEMVAFNKKWKAFQKPLSAPRGEISSPTSKYPVPGYPSEGRPAGNLSPMDVLKNAFDNLDRRVGQLDNWVKFGLIVGAIGAVTGIMALASILK